jgi:hypothetical protein
MLLEGMRKFSAMMPCGNSSCQQVFPGGTGFKGASLMEIFLAPSEAVSPSMCIPDAEIPVLSEDRAIAQSQERTNAA